MSILSNNFVLAGILATVLIVIYYYYVNHLMKSQSVEGEENREVPMSVSLVDYGKKFVMFYILGFGIVFVGKKYLIKEDSTDSKNGNTNSETTSGGGFLSNFFSSSNTKSSTNENSNSLSEVNINKSNNNIENFNTGQPKF